MAEPAQIRPTSEQQVAGEVQPRVVLQPLAAPSILGLFGFAGATLIVAANMAGWYGNSTTTAFFLAPFALAFGGIAQFLAGMWAFKARDGLATAMHGMWGSFWIGYGILWLLVGTGVLPTSGLDTAFGFWFIPLAAITYSGAFAALSDGNLGVFSVLLLLATGAAFAAGALMSGGHFWEIVAGWLFVASAVDAWYVATAMMLEGAAGKVILPLFKMRKDTNIPGRKPTRPIQLEWAEPGIKRGQ
ncbi:MAG TPA: GPR1/FUN34/YaaH family transporter [Actinomycetota bacterium]|jgi:succinate-acetate transporter protein|nr:GPR1/FUN34/YaaH family transporter [Actinomycetota bacterium]